MKKKILAGIMMMIMVFASVMGVSAAESRTNEVYVSTADEDGFYKVASSTTEFTRLEKTDAKLASAIKKFNAGKADEEDLFSKDILEDIEGKKMVGKTDIMDLLAVNGGQPKDGKHEVTITVTSLTKNAKNPVVVYYDVVAKEWKTQVPKKIDYKTGKITIVLDALAGVTEEFWPFAIYADIIEDAATGTSPSTVGTSSAWMLWVAVAVAAMGSVVVTTQKRK